MRLSLPMTLSHRSALALAALAALGLAAARPAAAQDLTGQTVDVTARYPDKSTVNHDAGTKTITSAGAVFSDATNNITVTPTQVTFTFNGTYPFVPLFGSGAFNGYAVTETGTSPVGITGATLDPSSNLAGFGAGQVSFDAKDVFADFQGLTPTSSNKVILDLTFAPPKTAAVPEPSQTLAFACGGLGLVGLVAARRKRANEKASSAL